MPNARQLRAAHERRVRRQRRRRYERWRRKRRINLALTALGLVVIAAVILLFFLG